MTSLETSNSTGAAAHKRRGRKRALSEISPQQDKLNKDIAVPPGQQQRGLATRKRLEAALEEFRSKGAAPATIMLLASKHRVPYTTLWDKAHGKHLNPNGRPFLLHERSERDLAVAILNFCERGSVMLRSEFIKISISYAQQLGFPDFKASPKWVNRFLTSWELEIWKEGRRKVLGIHRRIAARESIIEQFIQKLSFAYSRFLAVLATHLGKAVAELTHLDISPCIFGIDETSLSNHTPLKFEPVKLTSASGTSGLNCMQSVCQGQSTVCATLMEIFCADGSSPFHWLTTKQALQDHERAHLATINPNTSLHCVALESGRFNASLHSQVLTQLGAIRGGLPTLVIQDTPAMHKTDHSLLAADEANIFLVGLPTNSSWFLQQADDLPFMLNKNRHYSKVREFVNIHRRVPNLFETVEIYLEARKVVLTEHVIRRSFQRVGQYDPELLGPDMAQIRRKAIAARLRCSGTEDWDETTELRPDSETSQLCVELIRSSNDCIARIVAFQDASLPGRRVSTPISPELADLIANQEELRQAQQRLAEEFSAAQLAEARRHVSHLASLPVDQTEPEIVEAFPHTQYSVSDLDYLIAQQNLLRIRISSLVKQQSDTRCSPSGTVLVLGLGSVSSPLIIQSRKILLRDLKTLITQLKTLQIEKRGCLGCPKKRAPKTIWEICPICERGFCKSCSKNAALAIHEQTCADSTGNHPFLSQPEVDSSDSDSSTTDESFPEDDAQSDAESSAHEAPHRKDYCDNCGKMRFVLACTKGHDHCGSCVSLHSRCALTRRSRAL